jgi:prepilin-type N-terminal cleavage/methylation domain-containing protein
MRAAFTLIELAIVLCIISILSAVAFPKVGRLLDSIHVSGAVREIATLFNTARHVAIARSSRTSVEIDATRQTIHVVQDGDTIRTREIGLAHDVTLEATRPRMSYSASGLGYGAANLSVVVRRRSAVDTVFVSRLGRLRH